MSSGEDAEALYGALFRTVTEHFPEVKMGDRTDLVMDIYQVFHRWATGQSDEVHGVDADMVEVDYIVEDK